MIHEYKNSRLSKNFYFLFIRAYILSKTKAKHTKSALALMYVDMHVYMIEPIKHKFRDGVFYKRHTS